jgi:signal transduction histidine kinase
MGVLAYQELERRVAERTRKLSALYDVTATASASLDLETVMQRSLERVLAVMDGEIAAIHLLDESREWLRLAASQGVPADMVARIARVPVGAGLASWAVERGEPLSVPRLADTQRPLYVLPAMSDQAYIGAPMRARGRVLGVLSVVGKVGQHFDQDDESLLTSIADQVGVAVEHAQLYQQAEQLAVLRERQRLARELHDSVTQSLYSLVLVSEAARRLVAQRDLERAEEALVRLGGLGQQALKEMRLLVYELRPLSMQREGLVKVLQQRLEAVEGRAGVEATLTVEGALDLEATIQEELFRIVQEALNNALKHAAASSVSVRICAAAGRVQIEVADNGQGFDPEAVRDKGGIGLKSIGERVEMLGGTLSILSTPGEGTTVRVVLGTKESTASNGLQGSAEDAQGGF